MKKAFTMVELIFVIVIIGILAAVAIPKLAATRDDARISNIISNARTFTGDMTSYYTSQGNRVWTAATTYAETVSDVPLETACGTDMTATTVIAGTTFVLCDAPTGIPCLTFVTDTNGTHFTVTATAATTSVICNGVVTDQVIIGMTGGTRGTPKIHTLGGSNIGR